MDFFPKLSAKPAFKCNINVENPEKLKKKKKKPVEPKLKYRDMVVKALRSKKLKKPGGAPLKKIANYIEHRFKVKNSMYLIEKTLNWMICKQMVSVRDSGNYFLLRRHKKVKLAYERFNRQCCAKIQKCCERPKSCCARTQQRACNPSKRCKPRPKICRTKKGRRIKCRTKKKCPKPKPKKEGDGDEAPGPSSANQEKSDQPRNSCGPAYQSGSDCGPQASPGRYHGHTDLSGRDFGQQDPSGCDSGSPGPPSRKCGPSSPSGRKRAPPTRRRVTKTCLTPSTRHRKKAKSCCSAPARKEKDCCSSSAAPKPEPGCCCKPAPTAKSCAECCTAPQIKRKRRRLKYREMVIQAIKGLDQKRGSYFKKIVQYIEHKHNMQNIAWMVGRTVEWMHCKKMLKKLSSGKYTIKNEYPQGMAFERCHKGQEPIKKKNVKRSKMCPRKRMKKPRKKIPVSKRKDHDPIEEFGNNEDPDFLPGWLEPSNRPPRYYQEEVHMPIRRFVRRRRQQGVRIGPGLFF